MLMSFLPGVSQLLSIYGILRRRSTNGSFALRSMFGQVWSLRVFWSRFGHGLVIAVIGHFVEVESMSQELRRSAKAGTAGLKQDLHRTFTKVSFKSHLSQSPVPTCNLNVLLLTEFAIPDHQASYAWRQDSHRPG